MYIFIDVCDKYRPPHILTYTDPQNIEYASNKFQAMQIEQPIMEHHVFESSNIVFIESYSDSNMMHSAKTRTNVFKYFERHATK